MEALLCDNAAFVHTRYQEVMAEYQRRRGQNALKYDVTAPTSRQLHQGEQDSDIEDLLTNDFVLTNDTDNVWQHQHQESINRLRELHERWPKTHLQKKLVVLRAMMETLYQHPKWEDEDTAESTVMTKEEKQNTSSATSNIASQPNKNTVWEDASTPLPIKDLPLATQLGVRLFFRVCQILQDETKLRDNSRLVIQVAAKLPSLLTALPPFPLSPGMINIDEHPDEQLGSITSEGSVSPQVYGIFEQLLDLLAQVLNLPSEGIASADKLYLPQSDQSVVLVAFIALSLKRGRLCDLLTAIRLILVSPSILSAAQIQNLQPLLHELVSAEAEPRPITVMKAETYCGYLMSFGKGDHGKLGHGQCSHATCQDGNCTENKTVPTIINATRDVYFTKIDSLSTHSIAITDRGEVMAWGNGDKYRLGHGTTTKEFAPRIIESLATKGRVSDIACGLGHTLALMESGELYTWGNGSNGRLGLGDTTDRSTPTKVSLVRTDSVSGGSQSTHRIRHIYCGASHSLAISWDGTPFSWGKNNQGQCGHGHTNDQLTVEPIRYFTEEEEERIVHAAGGWEHTLFCTASGCVYSCGSGYKDSRRTGIPPVLGHGDCERRLIPTLVQALTDLNEEIVRVACGWDHSLAITTEGRLYSWGSGSNGKLGHGDEENCELPTLVRAMEDKHVKDAKAGCEHTVLLTNQHEVWTFGQGDSGRLGNGDCQTCKIPTKIESFAQRSLRPVAIAVGDKYNLVLVEEFEKMKCIGKGPGEIHELSRPEGRTSMERHHHHKDKRHRQDSHTKQNDRGILNLSASRVKWEWILNVAQDKIGGNSHTHTDSASYIKNKDKTVIELPEENPLVPMLPTNAEELALFLLGHIDRVADGYRGLDSEVQESLEYETSISEATERSYLLLPFAIDTSKEAFWSLFHLLQACYYDDIGARAASTEMPTGVIMYVCELTPVQRMCVVLLCLRILAINLNKHAEVNKTSMFVTSRGCVTLDSITKTEQNFSLEQQLHHVLSKFAGSNPFDISKLFYTQVSKSSGILPLSQVAITDKLSEEISQEAAKALKVGFTTFYLHHLARTSLLWEILTSGANGQPPSMKTLVLSDRLCEVTDLFLALCFAVAVKPIAIVVYVCDMKDHILEEILIHLFCGNTSKPGAIINHLCTQVPTGLSSENIRADSTGQSSDVNASSLIYVILLLLRRYSNQAEARLEDEHFQDLHHSPDCFLTLLSIIQVHLFSLAREHILHQVEAVNGATNDASADGFTICACIIDALLVYLESLLSESFIVLKKLHKASCQREEVITWRLNGSFIHALLPGALEAHCVFIDYFTSTFGSSNIGGDRFQVRESLQLRFVQRLIPHLTPMLKLLDEVNWKMQGSQEVNNQVSEGMDDRLSTTLDSTEGSTWFMELEDACAILCGKLCCIMLDRSFNCFSYINSAAQNDKVISRLLVKAAMFPQELSKCSSGSNDTHVQTEMAAIMEWEQTGVFEVEDELILNEANSIELRSAYSNDSNAAGMMAEHQRFAKDYISTDTTDSSNASFLATVVSQLTQNGILSIPSERISDEFITLGNCIAIIAIWNLKQIPALQDYYNHIKAIATTDTENIGPVHIPTTLKNIFAATFRFILSGFQLINKISKDDLDNAIRNSKFLLNLLPNPDLFSAFMNMNKGCIHGASEFGLHLPRFLLRSIDLAQIEASLVQHHVDKSLFRNGLCLYHDILRKLTTSSSQNYLLLQLMDLIHIKCKKSVKWRLFWKQYNVHDTDRIHIRKSVENLYIRLTKMISREESSFDVKKTAIMMWSLPLEILGLDTEAAIDVVAKSGIVSVLSELMVDAEGVVDDLSPVNRTNSSFQSTRWKAYHCAPYLLNSKLSTSGLPASSKLKAVEELVFGQDSVLGSITWEAFCAIAIQLNKSDSFHHIRSAALWISVPVLTTSNRNLTLHENITPRATAISPRKRLTLPKKMIILTVAESIDQVMDTLFLTLTSVKYELNDQLKSASRLQTLLTRTDSSLKRGNDDSNMCTSRIYLFGNPTHLLSVHPHTLQAMTPSHEDNLKRLANSKLPMELNNFTVSCWLHLDQTGVKTYYSADQSEKHMCLLALGGNSDKVVSSELEQQPGKLDPKTTVFVVYIREYGCKQASLGIAMKIDDSHTKEMRKEATDSWIVYCAEDHITIGSWVHIATSYHFSSNQLLLYINGKRSNCLRVFANETADLSNNNAFRSTLRWSTLSIGGILHASFLDSSGNCSSDNPQASGHRSHSLNAIIDDVWVIHRTLSDAEILDISNRGTVLFQVRSQQRIEKHCLEVLQLLFHLTASPNQEEQEANKSVHRQPSDTFSNRWTTLLIELLSLCSSNPCAQVYLCELLNQILPYVSPTPSVSLSTIGLMLFGSKGATDKSTWHVQSIRDIFWAFNGSDSTDQLMLQRKHNMPLLAMMVKHKILTCPTTFTTAIQYEDEERCPKHKTETLLHQEINSCRNPILSQVESVLYASGVRLFQRLWKTELWSQELAVMVKIALESISSEGRGQYVNEEHPDNALVSVMGMICGYSELSVNEHKVRTQWARLNLLSSTTEMEMPLTSVLIMENDADVQIQAMQSLLNRFFDNWAPEKNGLSGREEIIKRHEGNSKAIRAADLQLAQRLHFQSMLLRSLMVQLQGPSAMRWRQFLKQNSTVCEQIFQLASASLTAYISSKLGPDAKSALKLPSLRVFKKEFIQCEVHAERIHLRKLSYQEKLQWAIWETVCDSDSKSIPLWWQKRPSTSSSPLEIAGGDVEVCELSVKALQHFPTVRLGKTVISAHTGMWFYEVVLLTDGLMQIGYIDGDFSSDPIQGQGVGDHINSWAFDGFRCKKWNVGAFDYGETWRTDDVVGVLLDTDRMELSYFLNGKFLGVAFSGLPITSISQMYPAASLNVNQMLRFNFGPRILPGTTLSESEMMQAFLHAPVLDSEQDQSRLQPIALAMDIPYDDMNETPRKNTARDGSEQEIDDEQEENTNFDDASGITSGNVLSGRIDNLQNLLRMIQTSHEGESRGGAETAIESQHDLIDGLTEHGIPREWALRYASEASSSADESDAMNWILNAIGKKANAVENIASMDSVGATLDVASFYQLGQVSGDDLAGVSQQRSDMYVGNGHSHYDSGIRPHFEQNVRRRSLLMFSELERRNDPRVSSATNFSASSARASVNPFLSAEQDERASDENVWECFRTQCPTDGYPEKIEAKLLNGSKNLDESQSTKRVSVDLLPLGIAIDASLAIGYAHQCLLSLLMGDNVASISGFVSRWLLRGDGQQFIRFVKVVLDLEQFEPTFASEVLPRSSPFTPIQLQRMLLLLLQWEAANGNNRASFESDPEAGSLQQCFPLYHLVFGELQDQCSQALTQVKSAKKGKQNDSQAMELMTLNTIWSLWLSGLIFTYVEDFTTGGSLEDPIEFMQLMRTTCFSVSFLDNLVRIASAASSDFMPWKYAAFTMIKRIIFNVQRYAPNLQESTTSTSDNKGWFEGPVSAFLSSAHIGSILELFAVRFRKENLSRVYFSSLTRLLFGLLSRSVGPLLQISSLNDAKYSNSESFCMEGDAFCIEGYSSTHATISWNQTSDQKITAVITHNDEDETFDNKVPSPDFENTMLSLEVKPQILVLPGESVPKINMSPLILPSKGTFVVRNLLPDTRYILRLIQLKTMMGSDATSSSENALTFDPSSTQSSGTVVSELMLQTPPEPLFELNPNAMGKNLILFNHNLSIKNLVNKKWHTVRTSAGFEEGIHQWHVRIDTCVSKNIFIGVCTAQASLENYIGSDAFGYGYLANKAIWHNKTKLHSFGEIFKQGDLIQVTLDCDAKTLAFSRNGEYLGIAAPNLHVSNGSNDKNTAEDIWDGEKNCKWYPAFSLYNKDDQLTLIPPSSSSIFARPSRLQCASTLELLEAMNTVFDFQRLSEQVAMNKGDGDSRLYRNSFELFQKWQRGELVFREIGLGHIISICSNPASTSAVYGLAPGDTTFMAKGQCVVLGEYQHELWYEVSDNASLMGGKKCDLGSWDLHTCKEILASPAKFPVHRRGTHISNSLDLAQISSNYDEAMKVGVNDLNFKECPSSEKLNLSANDPLEHFVESQQLFGSSADVWLIQFLDSLATSRGLNDPLHLSFSDVSSALMLRKPDFPTIISELKTPHLLARIGLLLHVNMNLYRVIRLILPESTFSVTFPNVSECAQKGEAKELEEMSTPKSFAISVTASMASLLRSTSWTMADPSDFAQIPHLAKTLLFQTQKDRLMDKALHETVTPTKHASINELLSQTNDVKGLSGDFGELPIIRVVFPKVKVAPYWEQHTGSHVNRYVVSKSAYECTLFGQVSKQLAAHGADEWRHECSTPFEPLVISRTFQVVIEAGADTLTGSNQRTSGVENDENDNQQMDGESASSSQIRYYLHLWDELMKEIQSPAFPLFVPVAVSNKEQTQLRYQDCDSSSHIGDMGLRLDVNTWLFSPVVIADCGIGNDEVLLWYFHVGQLLGMAWRGKFVLPLEFISISFWDDLVNPLLEVTPSTSPTFHDHEFINSTLRRHAIDAIRNGLCSIIPTHCLFLVSPQTLRTRLSDCNVMYLDQLTQHAIYNPSNKHHQMFWSIVSRFTSIERQIFHKFLTGDKVHPCYKDEEYSSDAEAPVSPPFVLELVEALPDAQENPDASYPVAVMSSNATKCILHLPKYSTASVMRQKLFVAMTSMSVM